VLASLTLVIFALFYLREGPALFGFLTFHRQRGIEIESTYSTLLLMLRPFGCDFEVYHAHGSVNLRSALTPLLTAGAPLMMALALLAALAVVVITLRRQGRHFDAATTVARAYPRLLAAGTLLLLLASIAFNKVFSVQYLMWVLPLVALIDFPPVQRRLFFAGWLVVSVLTMRIFPDCFIGAIVQVIQYDADSVLLDGPTGHGALLLFTRNSLFLVLTVWVGMHLAGRGAGSPWRLAALRRSRILSA
jgi:hypothetical protein